MLQSLTIKDKLKPRSKNPLKKTLETETWCRRSREQPLRTSPPFQATTGETSIDSPEHTRAH